MAKKVFVSGCYDLLHSGHVEFFRQASQYGDLYVGIGSDKTILHYKNHKTAYSEQERLFMVKSIRYVKDAYINAGDGILDFLPTTGWCAAGLDYSPVRGAEGNIEFLLHLLPDAANVERIDEDSINDIISSAYDKIIKSPKEGL
jgi:cytidyltransferase-like protein